MTTRQKQVRPVTFHGDYNLICEIDEICLREGKSRTEIIHESLRSFLNNYQPSERPSSGWACVVGR